MPFVSSGASVAASDTTPAATGTAAAGTSATYSRSDHVHATGSATVTNAMMVANTLTSASVAVDGLANAQKVAPRWWLDDFVSGTFTDANAVTGTVTQITTPFSIAQCDAGAVNYLVGKQTIRPDAWTTVTLEMRMRRTGTPAATDFRCGFTTGATNSTVSNILMEVTGAMNATDMRLTTTNASSATNSTVFTTAAIDTWMLARFVITAGNVDLYKDDVLVKSNTTNIPSAINLRPIFGETTTGTTGYLFELDWWRLTYA